MILVPKKQYHSYLGYSSVVLFYLISEGVVGILTQLFIARRGCLQRQRVTRAIDSSRSISRRSVWGRGIGSVLVQKALDKPKLSASKMDVISSSPPPIQ